MKYRQQNGFTLIELSVYIGLLGILIIIMSQMFIAILDVRLESASTSVIQQDGGYIEARIAYDVHRASSILSPPLGQVASALSLDIIESGVHKTYQYTLNGTDLVLSDGTDSDKLTSSGSAVTRFFVTRVGNSGTLPGAKDTVAVDMILTSQYQLPRAPDHLQYRFAAGLR